MVNENMPDNPAVMSPGHMAPATPQSKIADSVRDVSSGNDPIQEHQESAISREKTPFTAKEKNSLSSILSTLSEDDLEDLYTRWSKFKSKNDRVRSQASDEEKRKNNDFPTIAFIVFVLRDLCEQERCTLHEKPVTKTT